MQQRLWLMSIGAAFLALACGPAGTQPASGPEAGGSPKYGGTLNVHVSPDPFNWDITFSKSNPNQDGVALAYSSLLGLSLNSPVRSR